MCQVYAFGFAQRDASFTASPWTDCMALMKQQFGSELPTLFEMLKANPAATLVHFSWNLGLALNGFQVALFNAMSGTVNPDYAPVDGGKWYAAVLSLLAALILIGGGYRLWSGWATLKPRLIERRHLVVIIASLACVVFLIILTQRPRPSYLFAFTVCIMALIGMSADLLAHESVRRINIAALLIAAAVVLFLPFYQFEHRSSRPLYAKLSGLQPYQSLLAGNNKIILGDYAGELTNYLQLKTTTVGLSDARDRLQFLAQDYSALNAWDRRVSLAQFLKTQQFTAIYIEPRVMAELQQIPAAKDLLDGHSDYARLNSAFDGDWALFAIAPVPGLPRVLGLAGRRSDGVYQDGWLAPTGFVEVRTAASGNLVLRGMVPGGIGIDSQSVEIRDQAGAAIRKDLVAGPFKIELPVEVGQTRFTFAFARPATLPHGDGRSVGALLQSLAIEPR